MPELNISLTNPDAVVAETPAGIWLGSRVERSVLEGLARGDRGGESVERALRAARGGTVIHVAIEGGEPRRLTAWRAMFSGDETYYSMRPGGDIVVSDHLKNVMALLPPPARRPSELGISQHYLCKGIYDRDTYSAHVSRLSYGDRLDLDLSQLKPEVTLFDRIEIEPDPAATSDVVDRVSAVLDETLTPLRDAGTCTMFSGGIDSTLAVTYLGRDVTAATMTPDTPEFSVETDYAEAAARLLGIRLVRQNVAESDYLTLLEDVIDVLATPPVHHVYPFLATLFRRPETTFVVGEGADSAFGEGLRLARVANWFSSSPARAALRVAGLAPEPIGRRAAQVRHEAELLAHPLTAARGYAGTTLAGGDPSDAAEMLGDAVVDGILARHVAMTLDRVRMETPGRRRFFAHVELAGWRLVFGDLPRLDRQMAQGLGKRAVFPYIEPGVIAVLLRVPPDARYVRGLRSKWILKELLRRRLPGYPVHQRKNATGLPFARFYTSGPLAGVWERYRVPDVVDGFAHLLDRPSKVAWNAITHAVWEDRIVNSPDLEPHPAHITVRRSFGDR